MKQPATPFVSEHCMSLTAFISDEHDKKYFIKFAKRRKLSKSELLRKAVRAFVEGGSQRNFHEESRIDV